MTIRVGIYDAPQVAVRAAPTVLQRAPSTAGLQQLGQGISSVAQAIDEEAKRADNARVLEFQNKLIPFMTVQENKVRALQGSAVLKADKDGKSPVDTYFDAAKGFIATSMKDLGNERQRREAAKVAEAHMAKFSAVAQVHVANEQQAYQKSVHLDNLKVSKSQVSKLSASPEDVKEYMTSIEASVQELNPGMETGALVKENQSKAALDAVRDAVKGRQMVKGRLDHLMEYMTPEDKATAKDLAENGDAATEAIRIASSVFKKGMTNTEITAEADKHKDNTALHKALRHELEIRKRGTEEDQKDVDSSWYSDISSKVFGGGASLSALRADTDANKDISKEGRAAVLKLLDARMDHLRSKYEGDKDKTKFAEIVYLTESGELSTWTPKDLVKALPTYGGSAPMLYSAWKNANASGGAVKVSTTVRDAVIKDFGMDLKNENDAKVILEAMVKTTDKLTERMAGKGKGAEKPKQEEVLEELRLQVRPFLTERRTLRPNVAKSFVKMNPTEKVQAIDLLPDTQRRLIGAYIKANGLPDNDPDVILRASNTIDRLREQAPEEYAKIFNRAFPTYHQDKAKPYVRMSER